MKTSRKLTLVLLFFLAMLVAIDSLLGHRVAIFAVCFSTLWFAIAFILLTRPPAIPEFVSEQPGGDEQYVIRRDVVPHIPLPERFHLSLMVACGSCLLIWLSLTLLAA